MPELTNWLARVAETHFFLFEKLRNHLSNEVILQKGAGIIVIYIDGVEICYVVKRTTVRSR
jgi:hypothetical protein